MTGDPGNQQHIDRIARQLHAEAVTRIPPQTLAQLRPRAAPERSRRSRPLRAAWPLAAAGAAVLVLAVGMRTLVAPGPDPDAAAPPPAVAEAPTFDPFEDPLMTFEEDPDLFVWLASEAQPLAME